MALKKFKPTSPGRRFMTVLSFEELAQKQPERLLIEAKSEHAGRNFSGHISVRHRGGGHKVRYRKVDFVRRKDGVPARVAAIEYDPNRSARLALLHYRDGEKRYILAPLGVRVGDVVESGPNADIKAGNALPLASIPLGTVIHNLELSPGEGAKLVRSAGAAAQLMAKEGAYAQVRMPSGEVRMIAVTCRATIGQLGNVDHENQAIGKAGRSRWLGRRPTTRGVAMNPVDHPHGGGESKSTPGRPPTTPWGEMTLGKKTRRSKRTDKFIVKRRGK